MPADMLLALDLGTTTLGGRLLDSRGELLAEGRIFNPQAQLGADVITRLEAARAGQGERLRDLLISGIEELLGELLQRCGGNRDQVARIAAAGNPAICHLLLQASADSILFPPHRPLERCGRELAAREVGLQFDAPLYLFPLVSGYVGGDLVAFLYSQPSPVPGTLYVDVGTNGEMALFHQGGWLTTSVPAGPAFEGGGLPCGMTNREGAVSGVTLADDRLQLQVVGGGAPKGICGSGLVEAIAAARQGGLIDAAGTIVDPLQVETNLARCIVEGGSGRALRLYRDASVDLLIRQDDIRAFQLAKGALRAGVHCLLQRAKLDEAEVAEVVITGAFGFSLTPSALKRVAMLPGKMIDRIRFAEGGALKGCARLLLDPEGADAVGRLAARLKPYPLSGTPAFEKAFLSALDF